MITYRELSSLTKDLGFSASALYYATNNNNKHYFKTKIPKGNGEERELYVPDDFLKTIQRRIVDKILCYEEVSPYATAYRYGGSTVKNAKPHIGQSVILKLDIRHFFDCIVYPVIKEKVFPRERYSESNRILLTLLCVHEGTLPQGAPTSPVISNIIMKDFDNVVGWWCSQRKIIYTRYCDDMTFSGNFEPKKTIQFIKSEL
ncbi:MAG: reverse transcriptase domain-containing protein, partial [Clostridia bacterium]|nr:reverse transcriptase domain-containing protein [Clostridia bacterium]